MNRSMISIIIYIAIIVSIIIWYTFGASLETVQYHSNKILTTESSFPFYYCGYSCLLYSNEKIFRHFLPFSWVFYDEFGKPFGYIRQNVISFISTSNLFHVLDSINDTPNHYGLHSGYYNKLNKYISDILYFTSNYNELIICGHSMAGAIAGICGFCVSQKRPFQKIDIFIYGSPKFCTEKTIFPSSVTIYDYINVSDPVIYKPINSQYIRKGNRIEKCIDTGNDNVNHGLKVYRKIVMNEPFDDIPFRPHRYDEVIMRWFLDMLA